MLYCIYIVDRGLVKIVPKWKASDLDLLNVLQTFNMSDTIAELLAARAVTDWRLQHIDFKLHGSTLVAEGVTLLITVKVNQTKSE